MTEEEKTEVGPITDLGKRLRHMGDRLGRHDYSIGDYWNVVDDAVDALEAAERELDKSKRDFQSASGWMKSVLPDMECRNDEDCDHCLGLQIVNDWPVGAETEYQDELRTARAQVATLAAALWEWLAAEDAFKRHMDEANTSSWHPGYGDEHWHRYERAMVTARAALKAVEKTT